MPEIAQGTDPLKLRDDFPPVPRDAWESAIRNDLKGADYEKKLVWRTGEGISLQPYYRSEDVAVLGSPVESAPGEFPFLRGCGKPWEAAQDAPTRPETIRGDFFHEAGATAVQELAYALAQGVERVSELAERNGSVDRAAREIEFVFAAGSTFFPEIAKLRAARVLWASVISAFGPTEESASLMRIHVRTSRRNKSVYDRYTNLLRATTEALAAVIGGCDRLTVVPFGFDEHLALNVQRILAEESHLAVPADPAGGSYFLEVVTDSLAREAWRLFQEVESAGGYTAALASGAIEKALARTREDREKAVGLRRRTLVGVNNYPNLAEKSPEIDAPLAESQGHIREFRLAEPFEQIRERTARHSLAAGRYPRVLLLVRGDLKMRMARANFSLNFFGCAGFDIQASEEFEGKEADLIVLCSSDPEYLNLAREVCPRAQVPVLVAGYPKDRIEALQAAGIQGFIHLQSDAIRTLTEWQNRLGMKE